MFYHGTTPEAAQSMLQDGIDLFHPHKADPGDFGCGFYLTGSYERAKACGSTILVVSLDMLEYAYIPSPYDPDESEAGRLFKSLAFLDDDMLTCYCGVSKEEKQKVCTGIREEFLRRGWKGIRTDYHGGEIVVFDLSTVKKIERE